MKFVMTRARRRFGEILGQAYKNDIRIKRQITKEKFYMANETEQYVFYKVPKELLPDEKYKAVSTDAKMLYGLLLDRMHLPLKSGWTDKQGGVYQYFTIQQVQELLHFRHEKICRLFFKLETANLIYHKRQGQSKPSIIYLKKFYCFLIFRFQEF